MTIKIKTEKYPKDNQEQKYQNIKKNHVRRHQIKKLIIWIAVQIKKIKKSILKFTF